MRTLSASLLAYMRRFVEVPPDQAEIICANWTAQSLAVGEGLLAEGEICRSLFFVETGLLRFFFNRDGEFISKFFTEAPYVFTSQQSFTQQQPARESIEAIEACELWAIDLEEAEGLLRLSSWNVFVRKLLQEVQFNTEQLYQEAQTLTAETRYRRLMDTRPDWLLRIPQKDLASYLGIAPQSLSRIRRKLSSEG